MKKIRFYYSISGNFAEAAKAFGICESTVQGIIKAHPVPDNINAQKMKFSIKNFFSKCDQILKKSLMTNLIFLCSVLFCG